MTGYQTLLQNYVRNMRSLETWVVNIPKYRIRACSIAYDLSLPVTYLSCSVLADMQTLNPWPHVVSFLFRIRMARHICMQDLRDAVIRGGSRKYEREVPRKFLTLYHANRPIVRPLWRNIPKVFKNWQQREALTPWTPPLYPPLVMALLRQLRNVASEKLIAKADPLPTCLVTPINIASHLCCELAEWCQLNVST